MKPGESAVTVESSGPVGERAELSIDEQSLDMIQSMLTRQYTDPLGATIREIACNALDSHREAGVDTPIEVWTPTALSQDLVIVDHGTGMSARTILDEYSKYGFSTKRHTNNQTGMMGLGCKAPLALVDQFTLTSVKDGVKIEALVSRAQEGPGFAEVFSSEPTDEPNGTTVKVHMNADDTRRAQQKAEELFRYWSPEDVQLNGQDPPELENVEEYGDFLLQKGRTQGYNSYGNNSSDIIVMGGVPYPVPKPERISRGLNWSFRIIAYVPIGTVDPTPARDALEMTPRTRKALQELQERIVQHYINENMGVIHNASCYADARIHWLRLCNKLNSGYGYQSRVEEVTWQGEVLRRYPDFHESEIFHNHFILRWNPRQSHQPMRCSYTEALPLPYMTSDEEDGSRRPGPTVINNFPTTQLSGARRQALYAMLNWAAEHQDKNKEAEQIFQDFRGGKVAVIHAKGTHLAMKFYNKHSPIYDWADIWEKWGPVKGSASKKTATVVVEGAPGFVDYRGQPITDPKQTVVYYTSSCLAEKNARRPSHSLHVLCQELSTARKPLVAAKVDAHRWERLTREFPKSIRATEWLKTIDASTLLQQDQDLDLLYLMTRPGSSQWICDELAPRLVRQVNDPHVKKQLRRKQLQRTQWVAKIHRGFLFCTRDFKIPSRDPISNFRREHPGECLNGHPTLFAEYPLAKHVFSLSGVYDLEQHHRRTGRTRWSGDRDESDQFADRLIKQTVKHVATYMNAIYEQRNAT